MKELVMAIFSTVVVHATGSGGGATRTGRTTDDGVTGNQRQQESSHLRFPVQYVSVRVFRYTPICVLTWGLFAYSLNRGN